MVPQRISLQALFLLLALLAQGADAVNIRFNDESYEGDLSGEAEHHFPSRVHRRADPSDLASATKSNDLFLDHSRINEGEVFLFKNRKHRHRAIPVIRTGSRFSDALTFKEWMKNATKARDKVVKIVLRHTDVVRPVLQYLYAAQDSFESPILLHANVFRLSGTYDKTVDPLILIGSAQKMLPDATISLGWNDMRNLTNLKSSQKRVSWRQTFHMLNYINHISQPLILSMRLSVAQNSADQLLWLLGMNQTISVLVWSDEHDDDVDWFEILRLRSYSGGNKVIFDLVPKHREVLEQMGRLPTRKGDQLDASWLEMHERSSARPVLSKTFQSERGIAFLGWSNSFLLAKKTTEGERGFQPRSYSGKVLFLPKKGLRHISPLEDSGLSLQLVDPDRVSDSGEVDGGIQVLIGYDGRVFLENMDPDLEQAYNRRSSGRLLHYPCYGFRVVDRGWRIELDVWTDSCDGFHGHRLERPSTTSLELETPIRSRTPRSVMVSKSGDGEIDFLVQKLAHSSAFSPVISFAVLGLASTLLFLL
uniref:Alpha-galactosidase n=1 Tax=Steinernema glaseri TaxID=37863 RepID=A0A1I7ZHZ1_9BILA